MYLLKIFLKLRCGPHAPQQNKSGPKSKKAGNRCSRHYRIFACIYIPLSKGKILRPLFCKFAHTVYYLSLGQPYYKYVNGCRKPEGKAKQNNYRSQGHNKFRVSMEQSVLEIT